MSLNIETLNALSVSAQETRSVVRLPVGEGMSASGRPTTLYASFRLPVRALSATEVYTILAERLPNVLFPVSLPRVTDGKLTISVRSVYKGADLANVLVNTFGVVPPTKPEDNGAEDKGSKRGRKSKSEPLTVEPTVDGPVS